MIGRPRGFDTEAVLDAAQQVFWSKGYEATTMADLRAATGLNAGSIYAAFDSKAGLFARVVEHYSRTVAHYIPAALAEPNFDAMVHTLLTGVVTATTGDTTPRGCMLVGTLAIGAVDDEVRAEIRRQRRSSEQALIERVARAQRDGDLSAHQDPTVVATYLMTVAGGLAVEAATGGDPRTLTAAAELAHASLMASVHRGPAAVHTE